MSLRTPGAVDLFGACQPRGRPAGTPARRTRPASPKRHAGPATLQLGAAMRPRRHRVEDRLVERLHDGLRREHPLVVLRTCCRCAGGARASPPALAAPRRCPTRTRAAPCRPRLRRRWESPWCRRARVRVDEGVLRRAARPRCQAASGRGRSAKRRRGKTIRSIRRLYQRDLQNCSKSRYPVGSVKRCPACQALYTDDDAFCEVDGEVLAVDRSVAPTIPVAPPPTEIPVVGDAVGQRLYRVAPIPRRRAAAASDRSDARSRSRVRAPAPRVAAAPGGLRARRRGDARRCRTREASFVTPRSLRRARSAAGVRRGGGAGAPHARGLGPRGAVLRPEASAARHGGRAGAPGRGAPRAARRSASTPRRIFTSASGARSRRTRSRASSVHARASPSPR